MLVIKKEFFIVLVFKGSQDFIGDIAHRQLLQCISMYNKYDLSHIDFNVWKKE